MTARAPGPGGDDDAEATSDETSDRPLLALASLSGAADAEWAAQAADLADLAFLGGLALDEASRAAARDLVARDREEFLPDDPVQFANDHLTALADVPIRAGLNVRSATPGPVREAAAVCATHDAVVELNAHCRQPELTAVGCGESLLRDTDRLAEYVRVAAETGAAVSVKVRAEVPGVDLAATTAAIAAAGADAVHVDAMDSESVIRDVVGAADSAAETPTERLTVLANNEVRDRESAHEYLQNGAEGVSVGRPSTDRRVLRRVREALVAWAEGDRDLPAETAQRPAGETEVGP